MAGDDVSQIASVLDCVFSAGESTFYVLDMLYWKGQALCDCPAELRLFLVTSRLEDAGFSFDSQGLHEFSFVPLPCFACTPGMSLAQTLFLTQEIFNEINSYSI